MDTMDIHVILEKGISNSKINNIRWVDVTCLNADENKYKLIVHFPLYFYKSNIYLVQNQEEVDEVFCELYKLLKPFGLREAKITRIDYPFTFYMPEADSFYKYQSFFTLLSKTIKYTDKYKGEKGILELKPGQKLEYYMITDSTNTSKYNNKISFYDPKKKVIDIKGIAYYKELENDYPDISYRMRIEVSKKYNRKLDFLSYEIPKLKEIKENASEEIKIIFEKISESLQEEADYILNILHNYIDDKGIRYKDLMLENSKGYITNINSWDIVMNIHYSSKRTIEDARKKFKENIRKIILFEKIPLSKEDIKKQTFYMEPIKISNKILEAIEKESRIS